MSAINPVILLARERAQFRFSVLTAQMLQDARASLTQQIPVARSPAEQKTATLSRDFLEAQGRNFLDRLKAKYDMHLERGMQTMYRDLRPGMRNVSIDSLTLVDEQSVVRQMEVERRVLRLREADQNSLSRLNLMIAQLHNESDIRERENPFRPYLMARALHDVLIEMTATTDICTMLFDHLSGALASHLPDYFSAIREVFESNGVHARLVARPSAMTRRDRQMAQEHAAQPAVMQGFPATAFQAGGFSPTAMPTTIFQHTALQNSAFPAVAFAQSASEGQSVIVPSPLLERLLGLLKPAQEDGPNMLEPQPVDAQTALQDFIWKIFNQATPGRIPPNPRYPDGAPATPYRPEPVDKSRTQLPLFSRLARMQRDLASVNSQEVAHELASRLNLQASLSNEKLGELERVAVDMVSTLFTYIGNEKAVLRSFRAPILQLQVPFMKVTLLAPRLLQQPDHPARLLVNRMVTVATGLSSNSPIGKGIRDEMQRVVDSILRNFDEDAGIFSDALEHFNRAVEKVLTEADEEAVRAIAALRLLDGGVQEAQDAPTVQMANALRERLLGVQTDPRVIDFILSTWSRVLVHVEARDDVDSQPYLAVVPDLLWSVQPVGAADRNRLMRLVLTLVQRIKSGLQLIGLSEEAIRAQLDTLVELHTGALRPVQSEQIKPVLSMTELHRHFSALNLSPLGELDAPTIQAPTMPEDHLRAALNKFDVQAHVHFDRDVGTLLNTDTQWLSTFLPGAPVECWVREGYQAATLLSCDAKQLFYLFRLAGQSEPPRLLIYSSIALIKALREGSVCMAETAPVFDRAIESLLDTADGN